MYSYQLLSWNLVCYSLSNLNSTFVKFPLRWLSAENSTTAQIEPPIRILISTSNWQILSLVAYIKNKKKLALEPDGPPMQPKGWMRTLCCGGNNISSDSNIRRLPKLRNLLTIVSLSLFKQHAETKWIWFPDRLM